MVFKHNLIPGTEFFAQNHIILEIRLKKRNISFLIYAIYRSSSNNMEQFTDELENFILFKFIYLKKNHLKQIIKP